MLLNLKKIGGGARQEERSLDFASALDLSGVRLWGERPFQKPVEVKGCVTRRAGITSLRYTAEFKMQSACARCLSPVTTACEKSFEHTILSEPSAEDAENEFILAPDEQLDLGELVTADILLDLDGVLLCKEDCRGLCPKCGKNLNEGACGCDITEKDPRFDAIRKLLEQE